MDISKITVEKEEIDIAEFNINKFNVNKAYMITVKFFIEGDIEIYNFQFESPSLIYNTEESVIPRFFDEEWDFELESGDGEHAYDIVKYQTDLEIESCGSCHSQDSNSEESCCSCHSQDSSYEESTDKQKYHVSFESLMARNGIITSKFIVKNSDHIDNMLLEFEKIYQSMIESIEQSTSDNNDA